MRGVVMLLLLLMLGVHFADIFSYLIVFYSSVQFDNLIINDCSSCLRLYAIQFFTYDEH